MSLSLSESSDFPSTSLFLQQHRVSPSTAEFISSAPSFAYTTGGSGLFLFSKKRKGKCIGAGISGGPNIFSAVRMSRSVMASQGVGGGSTTLSSSSASIRKVGRPSDPPIGGTEEMPLPLPMGYLLGLICLYAIGRKHRG